jgi:hypothetical protein
MCSARAARTRDAATALQQPGSQQPPTLHRRSACCSVGAVARAFLGTRLGRAMAAPWSLRRGVATHVIHRAPGLHAGCTLGASPRTRTRNRNLCGGCSMTPPCLCACLSYLSVAGAGRRPCPSDAALRRVSSSAVCLGATVCTRRRVSSQAFTASYSYSRPGPPTVRSRPVSASDRLPQLAPWPREMARRCAAPPAKHSDSGCGLQGFYSRR